MRAGNNTHTYAGEGSRCIPRGNDDPNALQRWEQLPQGLHVLHGGSPISAVLAGRNGEQIQQMFDLRPFTFFCPRIWQIFPAQRRFLLGGFSYGEQCGCAAPGGPALPLPHAEHCLLTQG